MKKAIANTLTAEYDYLGKDPVKKMASKVVIKAMQDYIKCFELLETEKDKEKIDRLKTEIIQIEKFFKTPNAYFSILHYSGDYLLRNLKEQIKGE